MPSHEFARRRVGSMMSLLLAATLSPAAAWAQAAVQSDTPVPRRGALAPESTLPTTGAGARDAGVPNSVDGPGSPGTTGTGAAGTGPTNTMAAPGR